MPLTPVLHDLALLYLALTYGTDGRLDNVEQAAMRDRLFAWAPGLDPTRLDHVLHEAMLSYSNGLDNERLDALLTRLHDVLDAPGRQRVLDDLRTLARADAQVHREEVAFINRVADAWADDTTGT
jgi:uncharacterized tellurite resistance protein B-like protein